MANLDSHRTDAQLEDARFLLSTGASLDETARRVGLSVSTLETYLGNGTRAKARHTERTPHDRA